MIKLQSIQLWLQWSIPRLGLFQQKKSYMRTKKRSLRREIKISKAAPFQIQSTARPTTAGHKRTPPISLSDNQDKAFSHTLVLTNENSVLQIYKSTMMRPTSGVPFSFLFFFFLFHFPRISLISQILLKESISYLMSFCWIRLWPETDGGQNPLPKTEPVIQQECLQIPSPNFFIQCWDQKKSICKQYTFTNCFESCAGSVPSISACLLQPSFLRVLLSAIWEFSLMFLMSLEQT